MPRPPRTAPKRAEARSAVRSLANPTRAAQLLRYFKTGPGDYAQGDRFLGLTLPQIRGLAREFRALPLRDVEGLLRSPWHEERMLALLLLVRRYQRGDAEERGRVFRLYMRNLDRVDNWDLVDLSAEHIVGAHLPGNSPRLHRLASSPKVFRRRVAILATFHRIKQGEMAPTLRIAAQLLDDEHDLIHKAVGWMLREVWKRDPVKAERFLEKHLDRLPRTALRYAIERMPQGRRRAFMTGRPPRR